VARINTKAREVVLESGATLPYDMVCGPGVFVLMGFHECDSLSARTRVSLRAKWHLVRCRLS
jgi:hypothetical protein